MQKQLKLYTTQLLSRYKNYQCCKNIIVTEHFINNTDCAKNYMLSRFRVVSHCNNVIDLVRLEAISIFLNKPELCKQKEFDYKVSLKVWPFCFVVFSEKLCFKPCYSFCSKVYDGMHWKYIKMFNNSIRVFFVYFD